MTYAIPPILALALGMPRAELHVHIRGTWSQVSPWPPQRITAYADESRPQAAYADSLQSFLDHSYYACADVLRTREDFRDLMLAYLERASADEEWCMRRCRPPGPRRAGHPFARCSKNLDSSPKGPAAGASAAS